MKKSNQTNPTAQNRGVAILAALVVLGAGLSAVTANAATDQRGLPPEQQKRMEAMKAKGPDASLTILPVRLAG